MLGNLSTSFGAVDYLMSLPILLLTLFALGILLGDLLLPAEWKWMNPLTALIGIGFSAYGVARIQAWLARSGVPGESAFLNSLVVDHFTIYFWYLFLASAAISILMSVRYLEIEHENHGEFYSLILFSVVGMMCMAAGFDVVLIFIGLELMAISTYVLVGFLRGDRRSNEAALKYLLLGAFSSGIFAYGLSLFYGLTGSTSLLGIRSGLVSLAAAHQDHIDAVAVIALLTTATGLFFKIAAIPFHQWLPDAYEGAPTTVTGFMSVAVKAAAWAMLLRIFIWGLYPLRTRLCAAADFRCDRDHDRSQSGRAHPDQREAPAGLFIDRPCWLHAAGPDRSGFGNYPAPAFFDGFKGILLYLLVYTFMNLGAFAVIASLRQRNVIGDELDDLAGLYFRAPTEAVLMLIFLLSLAGIPPLAGFYGKYFIFLSLIESGHYVLASLAVLYAVFGLYYYMRIANQMFMREALDKTPLPISAGMRVALGVTAFATVYIGIFPEQFIRMVNWSLGIVQATPVADLIR